MTYYELVSYLDTLEKKSEILDDDINYINSKEISLKGERYIRFIGQLNYLMNERLRNFKNSVLDKLEIEYLDADNLILSMDPLRKEIDYLYKILNIKYILDINKDKFIESIVESNNSLVDSIKEYFTDEERQNIMNNYYMEVKE